MSDYGQIYCVGAQRLRGDLDFIHDPIGVALVGRGYTFDPFNHLRLADVAPVLGTARLEQERLDENGIAHGADLVFNCVNPSEVMGLVLYEDHCLADQSPVLAYFSRFQGVPLNPDGVDVTVQWDRRGIMTVEPCIAGAVESTETIVMVLDCATLASVDWSGWFGCHRLGAEVVDITQTAPIIDNLGQVDCQWAKAYLQRLHTAQVALENKRTVRWGERLITYDTASEVLRLITFWEYKVAQLCARGTQRRRPFSFTVCR